MPVVTQPPKWWPERWYYGWAIVGALGVVELASYGILSYAFTVFITPMGADLGWSKAQITGAFSLAALVGGAAAIPVGRWVDRHGARALMTFGSVLATALLIAWSQVRLLSTYYALSAVLGVAMAAVFYEPAFAVVATWFRRDRSRALTALTVIGGFGGAIFVPLAAWLVQGQGWRTALLWLAGIYGVLSVIPCAVVLRRRPLDLALAPDGGSVSNAGVARIASDTKSITERSVAVRQAVTGAAFPWLTVAFALSAFTTSAVSVHLVPLLIERGYKATGAATATGVLGLAAMAGRPVFVPLGNHWSRATVTASLFGLQAIALGILLVVPQGVGVWTFVILFGAGLGAITPARAALVADYYGHVHYGKISGVLALFVSVARAAAPIGASLLYALGAKRGHSAAQGYEPVLIVLAVLCVVSSATIFVAGRCAYGAHPRAGGPPPAY